MSTEVRGVQPFQDHDPCPCVEGTVEVDICDIVSGRETATIGADDDVDEAVRTMTKHAVRRLPVIDGDRVVGMLSQADIARAASDSDVAKLVRSISEAPDNTGQG